MADTYQQYPTFSQTEEPKQTSSTSLTQRQQRSLIFHLLYAMDAFAYEATLEGVAENLSRGFGYIIKPEDPVFQRARAVIDAREELDQIIAPLLEKWRLERVGLATRLILRFALWELKNTQEHSVVVINEAVELAKCFAEFEAYKFINGILDRWAKEHKS